MLTRFLPILLSVSGDANEDRRTAGDVGSAQDTVSSLAMAFADEGSSCASCDANGDLGMMGEVALGDEGSLILLRPLLDRRLSQLSFFCFVSSCADEDAVSDVLGKVSTAWMGEVVSTVSEVTGKAVGEEGSLILLRPLLKRRLSQLSFFCFLSSCADEDAVSNVLGKVSNMSVSTARVVV